MAVRIAVNGAMGRMGMRILELAQESKEFEIVGAFEHEASGHRGKKLELGQGHAVQIGKLSVEALKGKGVLIDFSGPTGTPTALVYAQKAKWGLVIGTTGIDAGTEEAIRSVSRAIPIVKSSNMSVGVNVMLALVAEAARKLSDDFALEMTEAHHSHKKDAPSGTALMLLKAVADAREWSAERTTKEKDRIRSIREGEIVGDHTVLFSGPSETIELTHRAHSRDAFARGALVAARFVSKRSKGFYTMADVLQMK